MRQRKQRDVAKENEFYMQLMQQALPMDSVVAAPVSTVQQQQLPQSVESTSTAMVPSPNTQSAKVHNNNKVQHEKNGHIPNGAAIANGIHPTTKSHHHRKSVDKCKEHEEQHNSSKTSHSDRHIDRQKVNHSHSNGSVVGAGAIEEMPTVQEHEPRTTRRREKKEQDKEREAAEYLQKLEADTKRLRSDLHSCRVSEQDLRLQV